MYSYSGNSEQRTVCGTKANIHCGECVHFTERFVFKTILALLRYDPCQRLCPLWRVNLLRSGSVRLIKELLPASDIITIIGYSWTQQFTFTMAACSWDYYSYLAIYSFLYMDEITYSNTDSEPTYACTVKPIDLKGPSVLNTSRQGTVL